MPRRKRAQEAKRRINRALAEQQQERVKEFMAALDLARDPLDDFFWRAYEEGEWCCEACDYNHPLSILADARAEIEQYRTRHACTRTRHAYYA